MCFVVKFLFFWGKVFTANGRCTYLVSVACESNAGLITLITAARSHPMICAHCKSPHRCTLIGMNVTWICLISVDIIFSMLVQFMACYRQAIFPHYRAISFMRFLLQFSTFQLILSKNIVNIC